MTDTAYIVGQFLEKRILSKNDFISLINSRDMPSGEKTDPAENAATVRSVLKSHAAEVSRSIFGNKIYTRGIIEFTNYCRNNCFYCGIRAGNTDADRYRLSQDEILACCEKGYSLGFRTFVLQGGEDPFYTDRMIADIVRSIKTSFTDCAVTLSIGEKEYDTYRMWREAGADRYLLRHETADENHYRKLHPEYMSLEHRKQCLQNLKSLGYQTGAGFMVGTPFQTTENIADDLLYLAALGPQMIGIGPFIHHSRTPFANEKDGSVELTLFLLSVLRIMFPEVLLPATTALGTLSPDGREQGVLCGANVIMPNLSPLEDRKKYMLYNNKICTGEEAAECRSCLQRRMQSIGYTLTVSRGDFCKSTVHSPVSQI
ncbi:MAG: [FeFe] hydrogenase H-cluster radical SAM maturase HydE [Treponema sp.]|nr:[FeFe] hydrogenase H-cluster radical SAM maturase HydE [Treponema sp.]